MDAARGWVLVSWENLAWVAVVGVGALLRATQAGQPLGPGEAANATAALALSGGGTSAMPGGALLAYAQALSMFAFGANDVIARLAPFLAGVALIAAPWMMRAMVGRAAALVVAALIAFSPSLVTASAQAEPAILAVFLSFLVLLAWTRMSRCHSLRWTPALGVSVGALLCAGPLAIPALLASVWVLVRQEVPRVPPLTLRLVALQAGVTAVLISTGGLSNLHGIQDGLIDPIGQLLRSLDAWSAPSTAAADMYALLLFEPLALLAGVAGAVIAWRRRELWSVGLAAVTATILVLSLLSGGASTQIRLLAIPALAVMAGPVLASVLKSAADPASRRYTLWACLMLVPLGWLTVFAVAHVNRPNPYVPSAVAAIPVALLVLILALLAYLRGPWQIARACAAVGVVALGVNMVHLAAMGVPALADLNHTIRTAPDIRVMASEVADAQAVFEMNRKSPVLLVNSALSPTVGWYLRDLKPNIVSESDLLLGGALIVSTPTSVPPEGGYLGRHYSLSAQPRRQPTGLGEWWLWYFFADSPGPERFDEVVLYLRS